MRKQLDNQRKEEELKKAAQEAINNYKKANEYKYNQFHASNGKQGSGLKEMQIIS